MNTPKNGFYYHYKHDPSGSINNSAYEVLGIGLHTDEKNYYVVYRPLYENIYLAPANVCIRPVEVFNESITNNGKTVPRFTPIIDLALISKLEKIRNEIYPN